MTPIVVFASDNCREDAESSSVKTPRDAKSTAGGHFPGCTCFACQILSLSAPPKKRRRLNSVTKKSESDIEDTENMKTADGKGRKPRRKRKKSTKARQSKTVRVSKQSKAARNDESSASSVKTPGTVKPTVGGHPAGCTCFACEILSLSAPPKKRRRLNSAVKKTESDIENKERKPRRKRKNVTKPRQSRTMRVSKQSTAAQRRRQKVKAKKRRRHSTITTSLDSKSKELIHRKLTKHFKWFDKIELQEFIDSVIKNVDVVKQGVTKMDILRIVKELDKDNKVMFSSGVIHKMDVDAIRPLQNQAGNHKCHRFDAHLK